jgi:hypothetical protein
MPRQIGQVFLAGRPVNQIDDECPHDRTPLLIEVLDRRLWFQDAFAIPKNGFVGSPKWLRHIDIVAGEAKPAHKKLRRRARNVVSRRRLSLGP